MEEIRIDYREDRDIPLASILELYRASEWSSAEKPDALHAGLQNSHSLVTAWHGDKLVRRIPHLHAHDDPRGADTGL